MRRIVKTHTPAKLAAWRDDNRKANHTYRDLSGTAAHAELKSRLLQEQGWLCAYTGRSIDDGSSHVEHLKPQSECEEWEDVEYRNVVACFPADGGDITYGYGAPIKASWWNEDLFVSPLSVECERSFRFVWSGHVHPNRADNEHAKKTISVLQLDAEPLRKLRKSRIDGFFGFGLNTRSRPLSVADAKIALANIDRRDHSGRLREFCFTLRQLLAKFIDQAEPAR